MKRALLVGISNYPSAPLKNPVADICAMGDFIQQNCDFSSVEKHTLANGVATTAGIRDNLQWLVGDAKPGDKLFFHYSGHGALLPINGELHSCLCPYDFDWTSEHAITDADFKTIFAAVPQGVEFLCVFDCCHAGGLMRGINLTRGINKPRSFPTEWAPTSLLTEIAALKNKCAVPLGFYRSFDHLEVAFLEACRSEQTASDGNALGAFTGSLLDVLQQPDGLAIDIDSVVYRTKGALFASGYNQEPQMRGDLEIRSRPWLHIAGEA